MRNSCRDTAPGTQTSSPFGIFPSCTTASASTKKGQQSFPCHAQYHPRLELQDAALTFRELGPPIPSSNNLWPFNDALVRIQVIG